MDAGPSKPGMHERMCTINEMILGERVAFHRKMFQVVLEGEEKIFLCCVNDLERFDLNTI
jgi:hypothetical protein